MKSRLRHGLLALLVAWSALSCLRELYSSWWLAKADPWTAEAPSTWRMGSSHVRSLAAFLSRLSVHLPAGSEAAFSSPQAPGNAAFFRFLWAAYLLPEVDLRPAAAAAHGVEVDYRIAYRVRLEDPTLEMVYETFDGALYRVVR